MAARAARKRPVEYSILYTATLCLLAFGAVMVYSASSAESLLSGTGDPSFYLKRYLMCGLIGLLVMHAASRHGLKVVKALTPILLISSFVLTAAVMLPGVGVTVNGATRWLGAGPLQFQPSELLKVSLVLYAAQSLAARPRATKTLGGLINPLLIVVAVACLLLLKQPDMGTALVICLAIGTLLIAAGTPVRLLGGILGTLIALATVVALFEPYRRERLTSFMDPFSDAGDTGFQAVQALTAIGSGGFFGVGLGESVQKIFYLPEAHTDMILAVIGEELGLVGILGVVLLYGMIGYAGLRAAKLAADLYSKLLAAGITSLILCQATLNFFAVLGMAPLTGVPLPFLSYGSTNLIVLLGAMGLLLNVAATGGRARRARAKPRLRGDRRRTRCRRIVIAAGGTAGHVVPALAVADALRGARRRRRVHRRRARRGGAGSGRGLSVPPRCACAGIDRRNPLRAARALLLAARATLRARRLLRRLGPTRCWAAAATWPARSACRALAAAAAGADRGRQPPRRHEPHAGAARRARVPRVPDRGARRRASTMVSGRPVPAGTGTADRAGGARALRDRRRTSPACSCSAARSGRGGSTTPRSTPSAPLACAVLHACGRRDHADLRHAWTRSARRRTTTCTPTSSRSPTRSRPPTWSSPAPAAR